MTADGPHEGSDVQTFAAIVIGSGFGGSVVAHRLQLALGRQASRKVLLLERGMPYPPGSFPRSPRDFSHGFWDPNSSGYGLFELWHFAHSNVLVSSGLGGGSLIYANVLIEKPRSSFKDPDDTPWPVGRDVLDHHYPIVKDVLERETLPAHYYDGSRGVPRDVPKTAEFKRAAEEADFTDVELAELAVTFKAGDAPAAPGVEFDDGTDNLHNRPRRTCTLVGECDLGCNEGAKNTLDYNYLSKFKADEGVIRTCCEAIEIGSRDDGYEVHYLQHIPARDRVVARGGGRQLIDGPRASARVRAPVVVLAAGTLGSTRLLLSSRASLPRLSPQLGRRFSSNGDMLLFARGCSQPGGRQLDLAPSRGPVITVVAEGGKGHEGLWLEDAGGPGISEWGWQAPEIIPNLTRALWARRRELLRGVIERRRQGRASGLAAAAFGSARASSAMLPLLAMGFDRAGGRIRLEEDGLALDWDPADSANHFKRAEAAAATIAKGLGGRLWPPTREQRRGYRGLTAHPLGGCPMGASSRDGVVDADGEVFGSPGLFVADGSVLRGPVGPNPSLTIAAMADHIANQAIRRMNDEPAPPAVARPVEGGG